MLPEIDLIIKRKDASTAQKLNELVEGEIRIVAKEGISLRSIGYMVAAETRGKLVSHMTPFIQEKLAENITFSAGEEKVFPFSFTNSKQVSYRGRNASIVTFIKPVIQLGGIKKKSSFRRFISFNTEGDRDDRTYMTFKAVSSPYQVKEEEITVEQVDMITLGALAIGAVVCLCILLYIEGNIRLFFMIVFCTLLFKTISSFLKYRMGTILAKLKNKDDSEFAIAVSNHNLWHGASNIKFYYQIIEEVKDRRGTSDSTYMHTLYKSGIQEIQQLKNPIDLKFEFPKEVLPISSSVNDVAIKWELVLRVQSWYIFSFTSSESFVVKYKEHE